MQGVSGRVLVVDDSEVIRQLIRVNLELEGFEVVTADDGADCLRVVHEARPDVITLDVMMPRLDGLRVAERLRSDPRTRAIPLALVSACGAGELESRGPARVDAVLAKPFEPSALVRMVRRLVGASGAGAVGAADGAGAAGHGPGAGGAGQADGAGRVGGTGAAGGFGEGWQPGAVGVGGER